VRQLRSQIQKKAFHRKTTAMKKKVRATKVSALKNVIENSDKTQVNSNILYRFFLSYIIEFDKLIII